MHIKQPKTHKKIFVCSECQYFPVSSEWEKYFLNQNTYKCPVCQKRTIFNQKDSILLQSQLFIEDSSTNATASSEALNKQVQLRQNNGVSVLILIEQSQNYIESFYLNPINYHLKNSFNIDKAKALNEKNHHFFSLHNLFLIHNHSLLTTKFNRFQFGRRRVSKAEHLFYCLDEYINQIKQLIVSQNKLKNDQHIKFTIIYAKRHKKQSTQENHQENLQENQYKFKKMVGFDYATYKQIKQAKPQQINDQIIVNQEQRLNNVNKNQKFIDLLEQIKVFFNQFYSLNFQERKDWSFPQQNWNFTCIFSECPNLEILKYMSKNYKKQKKYGKVKQQKSILQHFYLIEVEEESLRQQTTELEKDCPQIKINYCCLYEPFSKSRNNPSKTIHNLLSQALQKLNKSSIQSKNRQFPSKQNQKLENFILTFWTQSPKSQLLNIKNQLSNTNGQTINLKVQSVGIIKSEKIYDQHLLKSVQQIFSHQNPQKNVQQILSRIRTFKNSQQFILNRIVCQINYKKFFYVCDFNSILKENYEELDFLDENTLPQQFKNYSLTYENMIKKENPFKKSNHKVFLAQQPQVTKLRDQDYYVDSDEMQTL